jgi:hypothetical protein
MNMLRVIGGIGSLSLVAVLAFHLAVAFRPLILPTLRQLGKEQTTYFVMRVAGFSLSGIKSVERIAAGGSFWQLPTSWAAAIAHFCRSPNEV